MIIPTHIDANVDHLIKLHVDYPQAALDIDTNKLWIILRHSVTQQGFLDVSETKIEWEKYKQSYDEFTRKCHINYSIIKNISSDYKNSSITSEAIPVDQLILNSLRLFSVA